jgi:hypothetical protein
VPFLSLPIVIFSPAMLNLYWSSAALIHLLVAITVEPTSRVVKLRSDGLDDDVPAAREAILKDCDASPVAASRQKCFKFIRCHISVSFAQPKITMTADRSTSTAQSRANAATLEVVPSICLL